MGWDKMFANDMTGTCHWLNIQNIRNSSYNSTSEKEQLG